MWYRKLAAGALVLAMGIFALSMWKQDNDVVQDHAIAALHEPLPMVTGRARFGKAVEPEPVPTPPTTPAAKLGSEPF